MSDARSLASPPVSRTLPKLPVTTIVLTGNEEKHIERCLSRILPLVERVVVVDSFSTDATAEIAQRMGVEVVRHAFTHQAAQMQWALDSLAITTPWTMKLDADEYLEPGAQEALRRLLPSLDDDVTGLQFKLKVIFAGQWIRHGRYYSTILLRLWRTGVGQMEQRWMDEHIVLSRGRTAMVTGGDLVDHNLNDLSWWTDKHNRYATRHMLDYVNREHGMFRIDDRLRNTASAARRKRFMKNSVYGRTPLYLRATLFFLYRYVVRLGFLDGRTGYAFHFLHGFWLMMLIDAKIDEARRFIGAHGIEAFRAQLKARHGIDLDEAA